MRTRIQYSCNMGNKERLGSLHTTAAIPTPWYCLGYETCDTFRRVHRAESFLETCFKPAVVEIWLRFH
jgi:hypothetical protein